MPPPRLLAVLPVRLSPDRFSDFVVWIAPPLLSEKFPLKPSLVSVLAPPTLLSAPPWPEALLSVKSTAVRSTVPTKFLMAPPRLPTPPAEFSRNVDLAAAEIG